MCGVENEVILSKRINITLPDAVIDDLEWWAEYQGRSVANLAAFLIEMSIVQAKEKRDYPPKPDGSTQRK